MTHSVDYLLHATTVSDIHSYIASGATLQEAHTKATATKNGAAYFFQLCSDYSIFYIINEAITASVITRLCVSSRSWSALVQDYKCAKGVIMTRGGTAKKFGWKVSNV